MKRFILPNDPLILPNLWRWMTKHRSENRVGYLAYRSLSKLAQTLQVEWRVNYTCAKFFSWQLELAERLRPECYEEMYSDESAWVLFEEFCERHQVSMEECPAKEAERIPQQNRLFF